MSVEAPTTKLSVETVVPQPAIDKIDLLLAIDNSSSMADKQRILADALPDLLDGLDAFTQPRVPAREREHAADGTYAPSATCTNPLFAARLPTSGSDELCDLRRGPRSANLVYFALIGGVPNELVSDHACGADGADASGRSAAIDWTKVLGRDPSRWNDDGIDPHMLQSTRPRAGLPPPTASDTADPVHGRERRHRLLLRRGPGDHPLRPRARLHEAEPGEAEPGADGGALHDAVHPARRRQAGGLRRRRCQPRCRPATKLAGGSLAVARGRRLFPGERGAGRGDDRRHGRGTDCG